MHENEIGVWFICIKTSIFCANLLCQSSDNLLRVRIERLSNGHMESA